MSALALSIAWVVEPGKHPWASFQPWSLTRTNGKGEKAEK